MATEVMEVDVAWLPEIVPVDPRYDAAFVLIRWKGRPVGTATIAVRDGALDLAMLRAVALGAGSPVAEAIDTMRLRERLGMDDTPSLEDALPSISVAVCTRDRPDDLERCLTALQRVLFADEQEIVVVDSCSSGDATRLVCEQHPRVRYVREERPGLDIARNRALRESRSAIVAFTDDDAMPDPDWLRSLQRGFRHERTLCATGFTLPAELETDAQRWFEATNGFGRGLVPRLFDGIVHHPFDVARAGAGVNMALRRSVLELIGPFDEALDAGTPTRSGGDHDMFTRILAAGYCIAYQPSAICWHRHRREWHELVDTVRGYGTGVYAYLTRHLLRGETGAIRVAMGWLRWQVSALLRAPLGPEGRVTRQLGFAELRGCIEGPGAYLRSRRRAARTRE